MALVAAVCPNCGGKINVDDSKEAGICESCGTPFVTEKVIHQNVTNNNFAGATVNMSLAVDDQKRFENAMQMAMDSYNAGNEEECKNFCNEALSVNPKSSNAKVLKAATLLSKAKKIDPYVMSESGEQLIKQKEADLKENLKNEACGILNSIEDTSSLTDEYKSLVIKSCMRRLSKSFASYEFLGDLADLHLEWLDSLLIDSVFVSEIYGSSDCRYELVSNVTGENLKKIVELVYDKIKTHSDDEYWSYLAEILVERTISGNDELSIKAKEMQDFIKTAKTAKMKKNMKIKKYIALGVAIYLFLMILGALAK